jgi:small subunit ribosomal protein S17
MKQKKKQKTEKGKKKVAAGSSDSFNDRDCPFHGKLKVRGRIFEGKVKKKFPRRVVIEFERMIYVKKYERYAREKTRIHARLPDCMKEKVNVGNIIRVRECRPLSKIIHFVVTKKVKSGEKKK